MGRRLWLGLGVLVLVGFFLVWGVSRFRYRATDKLKSVKVGVILPLTGGAASVGKASLHGMELAVRDYDASRGEGEPKIDLVIEDDHADPASSVSAFQKLIAQQRTRLVLGPLTSGTSLAVAPLAQKNGVVILSPGASTPALTEAGDYVFRVELSETYGARVQADLAFSRLGFKTMALLYVNNEYGVGTARVFRERFTQLGGNIVADEAFAPGATDFRTALTKVKGTSPDGLFVVFQDDIVNIIKQRAELYLSVPVYTTPVFEDSANLKKLGPLAEGIIYTYYGTFDAAAESDVAGRFVTAYQKNFGESPSYYAALGYDAASVIIEALRASDFAEDKVKDSLYRIRGFQGVTGQMSFDQNGDVTKPVSLKIVRGGRFVTY